MNGILNKLLRVILGVALCVIVTGCDPSSEYAYFISNRSSSPIYIHFYPPKWGAEDSNPNGLNWAYNGGVYLLDSGYEKVKLKSPFELKPGQSLKFSNILECTVYVHDTPDKASLALWAKNFYIENIMLGDDPENPIKTIDEEYWSGPSNWVKQNKKTRYIEYWLIIDDDVINNNATNNFHRQ